MTRTTQNRNPGRGRKAQLHQAVAAAVVGLALAAAPAAHAQQAIGVPFLGKNHLSFSVTEHSRDGIDTQRAAVFGGVYGRRLNADDAAVNFTLVARTAVRALDGTKDGIVDAGLTLAATHAVRALDGLSITGAVAAGAVVWGQDGVNAAQDRGRVVATLPISAGLAYDLQMGRATIAPFITLTGAYSEEREYLNDTRIAGADGWRMGNAVGVSLRFRETVLSVSEVNRERGMPNRSRIVFSAGMSW